MRERSSVDPHGWHKETGDLLRAVAGGSIVGIPLLYTMEMWHLGMSVPEWHLLMLLVATLMVNFAFCYLSGFRDERSIPEAAMESVTSVGIAFVYSATIMALIGEITFTLSGAEMIGKILLESAAVSIGISFSGSQFERGSRTGESNQENADSPEKEGDARRRPHFPVAKLSPNDQQLRADLREMVAALAGSTVFALNVAPTEEVTLIAGRLSPVQLLVLLIVSGLLCYIILFAAHFRERKVHMESAFQHPVSETILTCALSLLVATGMLALLGDRSLLTHPSTIVASIVTLGLPAITGGAAGRLIA